MDIVMLINEGKEWFNMDKIKTDLEFFNCHDTGEFKEFAEQMEAVFDSLDINYERDTRGFKLQFEYKKTLDHMNLLNQIMAHLSIQYGWV